MTAIKDKFTQNNISKRIISALILIPVALILVYLGGYAFLGAMFMIATFMSYEWVGMVGRENYRLQALGALYILLPCVSLIYIRSLDDGMAMMIYLFLTVWATDTGAYVTGIIVGGPKIAPHISPSKTWSGAFGGLALAVLVSVALSEANGWNAGKMALYTVLLSIVSQVGDLLESHIKRVFNVKDSGAIIPGHGGVLDRLDSIMTTAPLLAILEVTKVIS